MFWMDFKTFSPKPISCNFRRTTLPNFVRKTGEMRTKTKIMKIKTFLSKGFQRVAFLCEDSKISFEKKHSVDKKFD